MRATLEAKWKSSGRHQLVVGANAAGTGLVVLDGKRTSFLDASLASCASFTSHVPPHDFRLLAHDDGEHCIVAAEDRLVVIDRRGRQIAAHRTSPWGGGLSGSALLHGNALWSVHFPEEPPSDEPNWELLRLNELSLRVEQRADLSWVEGLQLDLRASADPGEVAIDVYDAPDFLETLRCRLRDGALVVESAPHRLGEIMRIEGHGPGTTLVVRFDDTLVLFDDRDGREIASALEAEVFGHDESGGPKDQVARVVSGTESTLLVHTNEGYLCELRALDGRLVIERCDLPGVEIHHSGFRLVDERRGFEGSVTRESTHIRTAIAWGSSRVLTVHWAEHDRDTDVRAWRIERSL